MKDDSEIVMAHFIKHFFFHGRSCVFFIVVINGIRLFLVRRLSKPSVSTKAPDSSDCGIQVFFLLPCLGYIRERRHGCVKGIKVPVCGRGLNIRGTEF